MINSRNIYDLNYETANMCREFVKACAAEGIDVIITSTYRDHESQAALYAQGRSTPGKIVTKAKAGHSWHNWRMAFDFVPCINGKPVWDDDSLWNRCGAIGIKCGLEWGGSWVGFQDKPHFQNIGDKTISGMLASGVKP